MELQDRGVAAGSAGGCLDGVRDRVVGMLELFSLPCFPVPADFWDLYGFIIPFHIEYPEVLIL